MFAADIRRQRVSPMRGFRHWKWHLDEVYVKIDGEMHYLWRAVDQEGEVLASYVTKKCDKAAALRFMRKVLKRHGRIENSHLPFRRRERAMQRFRQIEIATEVRLRARLDPQQLFAGTPSRRPPWPSGRT